MDRVVKAGTVTVVLLLLVLAMVALNPFGKDDQRETGDVHEVPTEEDVQDNEISTELETGSDLTEGGEEQMVQENTIVMFHNGTGPMCVEALEFFEENGIEVEEHLTTDENFSGLLTTYRESVDGVSEGKSLSFGYYPMIFVANRAFSGFDADVGGEILQVIEAEM